MEISRDAGSIPAASTHKACEFRKPFLFGFFLNMSMTCVAVNGWGRTDYRIALATACCPHPLPLSRRERGQNGTSQRERGQNGTSQTERGRKRRTECACYVSSRGTFRSWSQ